MDKQKVKEGITVLSSIGFKNVKWYDNDLEYVYYDAFFEDKKVEVRLKDNLIEWRLLGIPLEDIEWFEVISNFEEELSLLGIEDFQKEERKMFVDSK